VSIIGWLIIGLVAGALARLIVPGRDPMGWGGTLILGLAGSIVGGLIVRIFTAGTGVGLVGSVVGAVIVLLVYRAFTHNNRSTA
jgi:uncharacterized membrane protein YeaQ/YmgE (transglycosylase-associated protein family)